MEELQNINLFKSIFILETEDFHVKYTSGIEEHELINCWIGDITESSALTEMGIEYVGVTIFNHIELDVFEEVLTDLAVLYKSAYPYAERQDFIKSFFDTTIDELNEFILSDDLPLFDEAPFALVKNDSKTEQYVDYEHYEIYTRASNTLRLYAVDSKKDIQYFQQYFNRVITKIYEFDFDSLGNDSFLKEKASNSLETKSNSENKSSIRTKPLWT